MFKLIIAGSRTFNDFDLLVAKLDHLLSDKNQVTIISGGARGADALGERYAKLRDYPCQLFPAEWNKYGKSAGYRRNTQMADHADALVAFWDGKSRGTKHMVDIMAKQNKPLRKYISP